jgi:hypothetical protein
MERGDKKQAAFTLVSSMQSNMAPMRVVLIKKEAGDAYTQSSLSTGGY